MNNYSNNSTIKISKTVITTEIIIIIINYLCPKFVPKKYTLVFKFKLNEGVRERARSEQKGENEFQQPQHTQDNEGVVSRVEPLG